MSYFPVGLVLHPMVAKHLMSYLMVKCQHCPRLLVDSGAKSATPDRLCRVFHDMALPFSTTDLETLYSQVYHVFPHYMIQIGAEFMTSPPPEPSLDDVTEAAMQFAMPPDVGAPPETPALGWTRPTTVLAPLCEQEAKAYNADPRAWRPNEWRLKYADAYRTWVLDMDARAVQWRAFWKPFARYLKALSAVVRHIHYILEQIHVRKAPDWSRRPRDNPPQPHQTLRVKQIYLLLLRRMAWQLQEIIWTYKRVQVTTWGGLHHMRNEFLLRQESLVTDLHKEKKEVAVLEREGRHNSGPWITAQENCQRLSAVLETTERGLKIVDALLDKARRWMAEAVWARERVTGRCVVRGTGRAWLRDVPNPFVRPDGALVQAEAFGSSASSSSSKKKTTGDPRNRVPLEALRDTMGSPGPRKTTGSPDARHEPPLDPLKSQSWTLFDHDIARAQLRSPQVSETEEWALYPDFLREKNRPAMAINAATAYAAHVSTQYYVDPLLTASNVYTTLKSMNTVVRAALQSTSPPSDIHPDGIFLHCAIVHGGCGFPQLSLAHKSPELIQGTLPGFVTLDSAMPAVGQVYANAFWDRQVDLPERKSKKKKLPDETGVAATKRVSKGCSVLRRPEGWGEMTPESKRSRDHQYNLFQAFQTHHPPTHEEQREFMGLPIRLRVPDDTDAYRNLLERGVLDVSDERRHVWDEASDNDFPLEYVHIKSMFCNLLEVDVKRLGMQPDRTRPAWFFMHVMHFPSPGKYYMSLVPSSGGDELQSVVDGAILTYLKLVEDAEELRDTEQVLTLRWPHLPIHGELLQNRTLSPYGIRLHRFHRLVQNTVNRLIQDSSPLAEPNMKLFGNRSSFSTAFAEVSIEGLVEFSEPKKKKKKLTKDKVLTLDMLTDPPARKGNEDMSQRRLADRLLHAELRGGPPNDDDNNNTMVSSLVNVTLPLPEDESVTALRNTQQHTSSKDVIKFRIRSFAKSEAGRDGRMREAVSKRVTSSARTVQAGGIDFNMTHAIQGHDLCRGMSIPAPASVYTMQTLQEFGRDAARRQRGLVAQHQLRCKWHLNGQRRRGLRETRENPDLVHGLVFPTVHSIQSHTDAPRRAMPFQPIDWAETIQVSDIVNVTQGTLLMDRSRLAPEAVRLASLSGQRNETARSLLSHPPRDFHSLLQLQQQRTWRYAVQEQFPSQRVHTSDAVVPSESYGPSGSSMPFFPPPAMNDLPESCTWPIFVTRRAPVFKFILQSHALVGEPGGYVKLPNVDMGVMNGDCDGDAVMMCVPRTMDATFAAIQNFSASRLFLRFQAGSDVGMLQDGITMWYMLTLNTLPPLPWSWFIQCLSALKCYETLAPHDIVGHALAVRYFSDRQWAHETRPTFYTRTPLEDEATNYLTCGWDVRDLLLHVLQGTSYVNTKGHRIFPRGITYRRNKAALSTQALQQLCTPLAPPPSGSSSTAPSSAPSSTATPSVSSSAAPSAPSSTAPLATPFTAPLECCSPVHASSCEVHIDQGWLSHGTLTKEDLGSGIGVLMAQVAIAHGANVACDVLDNMCRVTVVLSIRAGWGFSFDDRILDIATYREFRRSINASRLAEQAALAEFHDRTDDEHERFWHLSQGQAGLWLNDSLHQLRGQTARAQELKVHQLAAQRSDKLTALMKQWLEGTTKALPRYKHMVVIRHPDPQRQRAYQQRMHQVLAQHTTPHHWGTLNCVVDVADDAAMDRLVEQVTEALEALRKEEAALSPEEQARHVWGHVFSGWNLANMVNSKAKGKPSECIETMVGLDMQMLEGSSIPLTTDGRTTSYDAHGDGVDARGACHNFCYNKGLSLQCLIKHHMAGCDKIVKGQNQVFEMGTQHRGMCLQLSDIQQYNDGTIRDSTGSIISYAHGGSGASGTHYLPLSLASWATRMHHHATALAADVPWPVSSYWWLNASLVDQICYRYVRTTHGLASSHPGMPLLPPCVEYSLFPLYAPSPDVMTDDASSDQALQRTRKGKSGQKRKATSQPNAVKKPRRKPSTQRSFSPAKKNTVPPPASEPTFMDPTPDSLGARALPIKGDPPRTALRTKGNAPRTAPPVESGPKRTTLPVESDTRTTLPVESDTQTTLPVESDTQTPLPMESDTRTSLPVEGDTQTTLPVEGDTQTTLPVEGDTQTTLPVEGDPVGTTVQAVSSMVDQLIDQQVVVTAMDSSQWIGPPPLAEPETPSYAEAGSLFRAEPAEEKWDTEGLDETVWGWIRDGQWQQRLTPDAFRRLTSGIEAETDVLKQEEAELTMLNTFMVRHVLGLFRGCEDTGIRVPFLIESEIHALRNLKEHAPRSNMTPSQVRSLTARLVERIHGHGHCLWASMGAHGRFYGQRLLQWYILSELSVHRVLLHWALSLEELRTLVERLFGRFKDSRSQVGDMVGLRGAMGLCEPHEQSTLNLKHTLNLLLSNTEGIPRFITIIKLTICPQDFIVKAKLRRQEEVPKDTGYALVWDGKPDLTEEEQVVRHFTQIDSHLIFPSCGAVDYAQEIKTRLQQGGWEEVQVDADATDQAPLCSRFAFCLVLDGKRAAEWGLSIRRIVQSIRLSLHHCFVVTALAHEEEAHVRVYGRLLGGTEDLRERMRMAEEALRTGYDLTEKNCYQQYSSQWDYLNHYGQVLAQAVLPRTRIAQVQWEATTRTMTLRVDDGGHSALFLHALASRPEVVPQSFEYMDVRMRPQLHGIQAARRSLVNELVRLVHRLQPVCSSLCETVVDYMTADGGLTPLDWRGSVARANADPLTRGTINRSSVAIRDAITQGAEVPLRNMLTATMGGTSAPSGPHFHKTILLADAQHEAQVAKQLGPTTDKEWEEFLLARHHERYNPEWLYHYGTEAHSHLLTALPSDVDPSNVAYQARQRLLDNAAVAPLLAPTEWREEWNTCTGLTMAHAQGMVDNADEARHYYDQWRTGRPGLARLAAASRTPLQVIESRALQLATHYWERFHTILTQQDKSLEQNRSAAPGSDRNASGPTGKFDPHDSNGMLNSDSNTRFHDPNAMLNPDSNTMLHSHDPNGVLHSHDPNGMLHSHDSNGTRNLPDSSTKGDLELEARFTVGEYQSELQLQKGGLEVLCEALQTITQMPLQSLLRLDRHMPGSNRRWEMLLDDEGNAYHQQWTTKTAVTEPLDVPMGTYRVRVALSREQVQTEADMQYDDEYHQVEMEPDLATQPRHKQRFMVPVDGCVTVMIDCNHLEDGTETYHLEVERQGSQWPTRLSLVTFLQYVVATGCWLAHLIDRSGEE
jgi:hypothetical protein